MTLDHTSRRPTGANFENKTIGCSIRNRRTSRGLTILNAWQLPLPSGQEIPPMFAKIPAIFMGAIALGMGALVGSVVTTGKAMHSGDTSLPNVVTAALSESEPVQSPAMRTERTLIPARGPRIVQATPTPAASGPVANPPPAPPPTLPPPIAFQDALLKAANDLFS